MSDGAGWRRPSVLLGGGAAGERRPPPACRSKRLLPLPCAHPACPAPPRPTCAASPVDSILDKEAYSLEELLDEDELIQECKSLNARLTAYLKQRDTVERLVGDG